MADFLSLTIAQKAYLEAYKQNASGAAFAEQQKLLRALLQQVQKLEAKTPAAITKTISTFLNSQKGKKLVKNAEDIILKDILEKFFAVEAANIAGISASRYLQAALPIVVSDSITTKLLRDYRKQSVLDGLNADNFVKQLIAANIERAQKGLISYYSSGGELLPGGVRAALQPALRAARNYTNTTVNTALQSVSEFLEQKQELRDVGNAAYKVLNEMADKIISGKRLTDADADRLYQAGLRFKSYDDLNKTISLSAKDFQPEKMENQTVIWVSVLDSRTTEGCRYLHGKRFRAGSAPVPPRHYNCRSNLLPYVRGVDYSRGAKELLEDAGVSSLPDTISLEKYRRETLKITEKSVDEEVKRAVHARVALQKMRESAEDLRKRIPDARKDFAYFDFDEDGILFKNHFE